jgi:hypothetical protein
MSNSSGFTGYGISNVYPGWGSGVTQNLDTNPEPAEQQLLTSVDTPQAQMPVDKQTHTNMFFMLGGVVALIVLFGR